MKGSTLFLESLLYLASDDCTMLVFQRLLYLLPLVLLVGMRSTARADLVYDIEEPRDDDGRKSSYLPPFKRLTSTTYPVSRAEGGF